MARSAAQVAAQRKAAAASAAARRGRGKRPVPKRGVGRDGVTPLGSKSKRRAKGKKGKKGLPNTRKALIGALKPKRLKA